MMIGGMKTCGCCGRAFPDNGPTIQSTLEIMPRCQACRAELASMQAMQQEHVRWRHPDEAAVGTNVLHSSMGASQ
jgi:hypothetical protein